MAESDAAHTPFESWQKQMHDATEFWRQMASTRPMTGPSVGAMPDPLSMWRPFMDQATETWATAMKDGVPTMPSVDPIAQGKALLDQWIGTWDKLFSEAMQTEGFAKAMGQHLDQWLSQQGPLRKAGDETTESTLKTMGLPSRTQVVALARQLMELDDRIETIEDHLAAIRTQLEAVAPRPAARPAKGRTGAKAHSEESTK